VEKCPKCNAAIPCGYALVDNRGEPCLLEVVFHESKKVRVSEKFPRKSNTLFMVGFTEILHEGSSMRKKGVKSALKNLLRLFSSLEGINDLSNDVVGVEVGVIFLTDQRNFIERNVFVRNEEFVDTFVYHIILFNKRMVVEEFKEGNDNVGHAGGRCHIDDSFINSVNDVANFLILFYFFHEGNKEFIEIAIHLSENSECNAPWFKVC